MGGGETTILCGAVTFEEVIRSQPPRWYFSATTYYVQSQRSQRVVWALSEAGIRHISLKTPATFDRRRIN